MFLLYGIQSFEVFIYYPVTMHLSSLALFLSRNYWITTFWFLGITSSVVLQINLRIWMNLL